ncbi:uncharacterized protein LOC127244952 isoform X2 [Andrographis paniculata]|uniref:uncharacterized protein LOC127244952 isoform X2 n=1 Tax=Andrographis paniculata TaxID=175694 RepID=UPI0021E78D25|nr:uncharacterized protein LOC127244952 isoform X2 [Andrographis paniculata]
MAGEFHQHQHPLFYQSSGDGPSGGFGNFYNAAAGGTLNEGPAQMLSSPSQSQVKISPGGPSSSTLLLDSVPGLKHDTGLAVEWSVEEQYKLEEGLAKFASEPQIMQYIKIAALLNDKTVRDVALRCQWMARKRRKQDDQSIRKKFKEQKDKLKEMSLKNNITAPSSVSVPSYLSATKLHNLSDCMHSGVLSHMFRHLLEENNQAFLQISANLSTLKLQDNIELFSRTKNNLTTILNDMRNMPGVMGQMPPLPVLLNEELASSIFPNSSQFSVPGPILLKPEPGC